MYRRIIVAVDGSETSQAALKAAADLCTVFKSQLRIVYVVDLSPVFTGDNYYVPPDGVESALIESGNKILAAAGAAAKQTGCAAETTLIKLDQMNERVADVLVREAASWPADLIVVGTHGRRGLTRLFLGSVAEGVARLSTIPVLLLHGNTAGSPEPRNPGRA